MQNLSNDIKIKIMNLIPRRIHPVSLMIKKELNNYRNYVSSSHTDFYDRSDNVQENETDKEERYFYDWWTYYCERYILSEYIKRCRQSPKYLLRVVMYDLLRIYKVKQNYEHTLTISECKAIYFHGHSTIRKGRCIIRTDYLHNGMYQNIYGGDDEYISMVDRYVKAKCLMTEDEIEESNYGMQ